MDDITGVSIPHEAVTFDPATYYGAIRAFRDANAVNNVACMMAEAQLPVVETAANAYNQARGGVLENLRNQQRERNRELVDQREGRFNAEHKLASERETAEGLRADFFRKAAQAGLSLKEATHDAYEAAIDQAAREEIGVELHQADKLDVPQLKPFEEKGGSKFGRLLSNVFYSLLGGVSGILLGLAFASAMSGFVSTIDIEDGTVHPLGWMLFILGVGAVYAFGLALEKNVAPDEKTKLVNATLKDKAPIIEQRDGAVKFLYVLWAIMAAAEGWAVYVLTMEHKADLAERGVQLASLPMPVFFLFGLVASSPFFLWKRANARAKGRHLAEHEIEVARVQQRQEENREQQGRVNKARRKLRGSANVAAAAGVLQVLEQHEVQHHAPAVAEVNRLRIDIERLQRPVTLTSEQHNRLERLYGKYENERATLDNYLSQDEDDFDEVGVGRQIV